MVLGFLGSWWFFLAALLAVFSDAFLPFVPSGTIVVAAVLESGEAHTPLPALVGGVALASFAADLLLLRLARGGADRARRWLARRAGTADAAASVLRALERKTGRTVIVARFVPGGRSVLDLAVGTAANPPRRFIRWSAASAVVWATYIVGMGWLNENAFNTFWLSFAVSCAATTTISALVARRVARARARTRTELAEAA
ncbi:DedA family protein [Streptacidiphilus sp. MAP12-20]|uniref:DedA family protein n=1 Tax=Streptacidiphilus sp. MAP12-20 TaxID=3156299 RepID=UPI003513C426